VERREHFGAVAALAGDDKVGVGGEKLLHTLPGRRLVVGDQDRPVSFRQRPTPPRPRARARAASRSCRPPAHERLSTMRALRTWPATAPGYFRSRGPAVPSGRRSRRPRPPPTTRV